MLALLLLPLAAAALTLHGVPVAFSPITRQSRSLSLTLVRSKVHPTDVLLYFGANVFLVPSLDPSRMQGEFAPYTPRMKVANSGVAQKTGCRGVASSMMSSSSR